jgi:hypothetical protein
MKSKKTGKPTQKAVPLFTGDLMKKSSAPELFTRVTGKFDTIIKFPKKITFLKTDLTQP